jgi:hypothetical protein
MRILRALPFLWLVMLTVVGVVGFRFFNPAVREIARADERSRKVVIVQCKDYAFFVFDKRNTRYRFEAWDQLGLQAAYSPILDRYQATTAEVRAENDGIYTCLLDDKPLATWDGETWRKVYGKKQGTP